MEEIIYRYDFEDDNPGDIVEALNNDLSYTMWDLDQGLCIKIDYTGISIKKINK